jgi:hypothetical protein
LVRSYPEPPLPTESGPSTESSKPPRNYRFSIVFVLRSHWPVPVDTDTLTTPITGKFEHPLRDITAQEMFKNIQSAQYSYPGERGTKAKARGEEETA